MPPRRYSRDHTGLPKSHECVHSDTSNYAGAGLCHHDKGAHTRCVNYLSV